MRCEARLLTGDELLPWMESVPWRFAATMPKHPHSYSLKKLQDPVLFERVVVTIWERGFDRKYLNRLWRSIDVGDRHFIWVHTKPEPGAPPPLKDTILVNRAVYPQDRLDLYSLKP